MIDTTVLDMRSCTNTTLITTAQPEKHPKLLGTQPDVHTTRIGSAAQKSGLLLLMCLSLSAPANDFLS